MSQSQHNLITVNDLEKVFQIKVTAFKTKPLHALSGVSLNIKKGSTLSLVGESGCGKTTFGKVISGLYGADGGEILYENQNIAQKNPHQRGKLQKNIQMIFQDPYSSLNPRKKIGTILEQPLKIHTDYDKRKRQEIIEETCQDVGIDMDYLNRYPHQFSGGQRQRIAIARAIILRPEIVIADEPISALDVSIQAQILNLLMDLQESRSLTYLFITHDISVVEHLSDYVAVMYLGKIVEYGPREEIFNNPLHPYTKMLFSTVPNIHSPMINQSVLSMGEIPSPIDLPTGCYFCNRCMSKGEECSQVDPPMKHYDHGHDVRCLKV